MTAFEEVCLLSCENWVDSFPAEIPKHNFSKKHTEKMKKIFQQEPKENVHKLSKKTIKILLIAAILLALTATTVFAIPAFREFAIKKFSDHFEFSVVDVQKAKKVKELSVNYVPNGYEMVDEVVDSVIYKEYENENYRFCVRKYEIDGDFGLDNEQYVIEQIKINNMDAVYYYLEDEYRGVLFNDGKYAFIVDGNINKEELVKIAQNVK